MEKEKGADFFPVPPLTWRERGWRMLRKCRKRLTIKRELVALKLLIFVMNGATSVLYPFFIIHCLATGLTLTESGVIFALIPVFGSFGNPLAGFIADRLGDYKKVVIFFIFLSIICHGLLGFAVPIYSKKTITSYENVSSATLSVSCLANSNAVKDEQHVWPQIRFDASQNFTVDTEALNASSSVIGVLSINCKIDCEPDEETCFEANYSILRRCIYLDTIPKASFFQVPTVIPIDNPELFNSSIVFDMANAEFAFPRDNRTFLICPRAVQSTYCGINCELETEPILTRSDTTEISGNRILTFSTYTLFRVVGAMAVSSVMMLIDAGTIMMVKVHHGDFGIQRMFGIIGSLSFPPLGGYLVEVASLDTNKPTDYSPIFYLFCSMFAVGAFITWRVDLHIKPPGKQIWSNVWKLLGNVKVSSFVVIMLIIGCFYGILENYLFWYMGKFLKSSKWLMGMTNTVAGVSAIPVVAVSSWIIKSCGHTKIFMMSLVLYGVRFLAYSFVYDPYMILPVEILEALTFSLTFVTATVYSGKIAPGFVATLQGIIGAMHYSVGRGVGSLIAGTLFDYFPPRLVYQMVSGAAFGCGVIYAILHYTILRKAPNPKSIFAQSEQDTDHDKHTQSKENRDIFIPSTEDGNEKDQTLAALLELDHPSSDPYPSTIPDNIETSSLSRERRQI